MTEFARGKIGYICQLSRFVPKQREAMRSSEQYAKNPFKPSKLLERLETEFLVNITCGECTYI
jgi:hypothetical protein